MSWSSALPKIESALFCPPLMPAPPRKPSMPPELLPPWRGTMANSCVHAESCQFGRMKRENESDGMPGSMPLIDQAPRA